MRAASMKRVIEPVADAFADDVLRGLTSPRKTLPARYLYDTLGSALFDAICHLPWYEVTRAEHRLLAAHARDISLAADPDLLVELGPGSGEKLVALTRGLAHPRTLRQVHLVDVSHDALRAASRAVSQTGDWRVTTDTAAYEDGVQGLARIRPFGSRMLLLFLGSNIGNFDPPVAASILRRISGAMEPHDAFLLGADLVKPIERLRLAYDDPLGVTAAFNKNLLVRINRELDANFPIDAFDHRIEWDADHSRVEMHLVSRHTQSVTIDHLNLDLRFEAGETIWTESSYKYQLHDLQAMGADAGLRINHQWVDAAGQFALTLFVPA